MSARKRRDECLFCTSRRCHTRIYTSLARRGGPLYDEVACREHTRDLECDSDERIPGVPRTHLTSSARLRRSGLITEEERRLIEIGEGVVRLDTPNEEPAKYELTYQPERGVSRWELTSGGRVLGSGVFLSEAIVSAAGRDEEVPRS